MTLFVTRHGETHLNRMNRVCGVTESELTDKGRLQARRLAENLLKHRAEYKIKYMYVSPIKRARDTSQFIEKALGLTAVIEPRLHEFNFGTMEGIACTDPVFIEKRRNPYARFEGGESMFSAAQRIYNLIDDIKARHSTANENVLFVCHGTVGRIIDTYFTNMSSEYFVTYQIKNCEIRHYEL
ncbi:MAG: histidine phosphatase family protein [Treponema sp.]|nr:histidine phosphatase family protein [Treponema sp.]